MRDEGIEYMGIHPCVFTEIGIPYDMDDKYAYKTGDYSSQSAAMDANHFALEESRVNGYTLWTYVVTVRTVTRDLKRQAEHEYRTITIGEITGTAKTFPYSR